MSLQLRIPGLLLAITALLAWTACNRGGDEATHWDTTTGAPQQHLTDRTVLNQQAGMSPAFRAELVNEARTSKENKVTVRVVQRGLNLVSPNLPPTPNNASNGFIEYRVDGGPSNYTADTEFSIFNVPPGDHTVWVRLDDTARHALTEYQQLPVRIAPM